MMMYSPYDFEHLVQYFLNAAPLLDTLLQSFLEAMPTGELALLLSSWKSGAKRERLRV